MLILEGKDNALPLHFSTQILNMQHILVCCLNSNRIQSIQGITDFYLETKSYKQTRLVIKAFDNVFYLHLEPNTELFHPQAVIYQNGQNVPVDRDIIYKGHVIHADDSDYIWSNYKEQQDSLGWARLMIYKRQSLYRIFPFYNNFFFYI